METRILITGVRLVRGDKELWKATQELTSSPGLLVVVLAGGTVAGQLAGRSIPDWKLLGKVKLPKFLLEPRGKDADRTTLGSTWVRPDRIRLARTL